MIYFFKAKRLLRRKNKKIHGPKLQFTPSLYYICKIFSHTLQQSIRNQHPDLNHFSDFRNYY